MLVIIAGDPCFVYRNFSVQIFLQGMQVYLQTLLYLQSDYRGEVIHRVILYILQGKYLQCIHHQVYMKI